MDSNNKNKQRLFVSDNVLIGDWDEVQGVRLSTITQRDGDDAELDGLVIKGYETKFGVTNENGERYDPHCLDAFVQHYFVDKGFNLVVDVQHSDAVDDQVGRVIYLEVNSVGFYFVAYVPRTVARYEQVKAMLREGILQGFSKCGYATDWEWHYDEATGEYDYVTYKEFSLCSVSLVTMPANAAKFEKIGETVKDGVRFVNLLTADDVKPEPAPTKKSIFRQQ